MWSSLLAILGTLAGAVFGFAVNEVSYVLRTRREERLLLGRTLHELLVVRHKMKMIPTLMETLKSRIPAPVPPAADFSIRQVFRSFLTPLLAGEKERYDQAVSAASGAFPVLAFELRSKDTLGPILSQLAAVVPPTDAAAAEVLIKLEEQLTRTTLPVIEELMRRVASMCGRETRKDVDAVLAGQFEMPKELDKLIAEVLAAAKKAEGTPSK